MAVPVQSSENVELLQPIDRVLANNSQLRQPSTIGKLACKLAREAVFGTYVMKRCTPYGTKQYPHPPATTKIKRTKTIAFWGFPTILGKSDQV